MKILAIDTATEACSVALSIDGELRADHRVVPRQHAQLLLPMIDALMRQADLRPATLDGVLFGQGPGSFTGVRIAAAAVQGITLGAGIGVRGVSSLATIAQGCAREFGDTRVQVALDARMNEIYWGSYALDADGLMQVSLADRVLRPESIAAILTESAEMPPDASAADLSEPPEVRSDAGAVASSEPLNNRPGERHEHLDDESTVGVLAGSGAERYLDSLRRQFRQEHMVLRHQRLPDASDLLPLGLAEVAAHGWLAPESAVPVYLRNRVALTEAQRAAGETLN